MLKNKPCFVTFHESILVSLNFSANPGIQDEKKKKKKKNFFVFVNSGVWDKES